MRRFFIFTFFLMTLPIWATVTTQTIKVTYTCTGSAGPFPFSFAIGDPTGLTVTQNGTVLNPAAYNVVPYNNNFDKGGSVTLVDPCPFGQSLILQRNTPITQTSVFTDNMPIPMNTFENGLDKSTMIEQELSNSISSVSTQLAAATCPSGSVLQSSTGPICVPNGGGGAVCPSGHALQSTIGPVCVPAGGGSTPSPPSYAVQFANNGATTLQADQTFTVNPTTHNVNGNLNGVVNATGMTSPMVPAPYSHLCHGTISNGSSILTMTDCAFPSPMVNYVARVGDSGNGELNVGLSYLSPTTATMSSPATWTSNNTIISASINNGGTGCNVGDTMGISGGIGKQAIAQVNATNGSGVATSVFLVSGGGGYSSATGVTTVAAGARPATCSGVTLNTSTSLLPEIVYFGPDNCTQANAWFNSIKSVGRGILPPGYYLSSCPILNDQNTGFIMEGTSMTNTWIIDATPSSHADFVRVGASGSGNLNISQVNNITIMGNGQVTRGALTDVEPANAEINNVSVPESGAAAFYFDNGVGATFTNLVSQGTYERISQPVNCIVNAAPGPTVFVSPVCENFSGYVVEWLGSGQIVQGQLDLSTTGIVHVAQGAYLDLNGLDICEIWTCTLENKIEGVFRNSSGLNVVDAKPGSVLQSSNTDIRTVTAESGSAVAMGNIRAEPAAFDDQAGMWIEGPIVSLSGSDSTHQRQITYGPVTQHSYGGSGGHGEVQTNSGSLTFGGGCDSFGSAACYVNYLSYQQYPLSSAWKVSFAGQWNDNSVAFNTSCSYTSPTFVVNGGTVTCIQSPITFTNNNGQTIRTGQIIAYIPSAYVNFISFIGGVWSVYPDGQNVLYDYAKLNLPAITTPLWDCSTAACTLKGGAAYAPLTMESLGGNFIVKDTTDDTEFQMQAYHGQGTYLYTNATNNGNLFVMPGHQYSMEFHGLNTWIGANNHASTGNCTSFVCLGPAAFTMDADGTMQMGLLTSSKLLGLDASHNVASYTLTGSGPIVATPGTNTIDFSCPSCWTGSNTITGPGTSGYIPKWTGTTTQGNSLLDYGLTHTSAFNFGAPVYMGNMVASGTVQFSGLTGVGTAGRVLADSAGNLSIASPAVGVDTINGSAGAFTFSFGSGAGSCSGTTCTFTGSGSGGGSVTNFIANTSDWPSWLVPTVNTSSTTPTLLVSASAIPNSAIQNVSTTVSGATCTLGSSCSPTIDAAHGGTNIDTHTSTGVAQVSSGTWSVGSLALTSLAAQAADTVLTNATSGSAAPTAFAMPSCTGYKMSLYDTASHAWVCKTPAVLTTATSGGAAAGTTYDGSTARTFDYSSFGASPLAGSASLVTTGTITSGTWHGTAIGSQYGGTGQNWSASSGVPEYASGAASLFNATCNGSGSALNYTAGGTLGCNSSIAAATATSATTAGTATLATTATTANSIAGSPVINQFWGYNGTSQGWYVPSGNGTVNSGTANHLAIYASSTNAVSNDSTLTDDGTTLAYTGTSGLAVPIVTTNGTTNGAWGPISVGVLPSAETTNQVLLTVPNSVTHYTMILPGVQPTSGNTYLSCSAANPAICSWAAGGAGGGNNLTANSSGGAAPGSTYNGSAAVTFDYHSFGAAPLASPTFSGTVTVPNFALTTKMNVTTTTVAALPSVGNTTYDLRPVSDASVAGDAGCITGGGTVYQWCYWNGSIWKSTGGSASITYPGAGVVVSTGSAWGTSLTQPTGALVGAGQANTWTTGLQDFSAATMKLPASVTVGSNSITLPSSAGTVALTSQVPALVAAGGGAGINAYNAGTAVTSSRSDHTHRQRQTLTWYFPGTPSTGVQNLIMNAPMGITNAAITDMEVSMGTGSSSGNSTFNIQRCTGSCGGSSATFANIYATGLVIGTVTTTTNRSGSCSVAGTCGALTSTITTGDQFKVNLVGIGTSVADVTVTMTYVSETTN